MLSASNAIARNCFAPFAPAHKNSAGLRIITDCCGNVAAPHERTPGSVVTAENDGPVTPQPRSTHLYFVRSHRQENWENTKKVYRRRYENPPLDVGCCHVANDLTMTDRRTNRQTIQTNRQTGGHRICQRRLINVETQWRFKIWNIYGPAKLRFRFEFESDVPIPFDSKVTGRFENFESPRLPRLP